MGAKGDAGPTFKLKQYQENFSWNKKRWL